jgi:hypothetical protein
LVTDASEDSIAFILKIFDFFALKLEAKGFFKAPATTQHRTRREIPEDKYLNFFSFCKGQFAFRCLLNAHYAANLSGLFAG